MKKAATRTFLAVLHDLVAAMFAWGLSYLLRFNFELPPSLSDDVLHTALWVVPLEGIIFWRFGLYRGLWRYASVTDLRRIFLAVLTAAACISLVLWMFRVGALVPRSVLIINPVLMLLMMGGSRFIYRLWKEEGFYRGIKLRGEPVLVLGAGDAAVRLSKELALSHDWRLVGFLDDDTGKIGRMINGVKVLGALDTLSQWVERLSLHQVIIAMPSVSHRVRKRAIEICNDTGVQVLTVPSFDDLLNGRIAISQLRAVELDDLLGRDPVTMDDAGLHALLTGKTVLVTGAGGSIGSELCRQIARCNPHTLVLFELSEFPLYSIEQEFTDKFPALDIVCLIGDVRDTDRLHEVFRQYRPTIVFHAAAYKHVPLMERHNAWQAIRNNALGTWSVATAAQHHGVAKFVLISTDKAVNPTNVMGASKRLAEMICQGLQKHDGTRFVIVRFGNVLGSTGSVVPKFCEQIAKGGPITVTHPNITRYFMLIPEAAQLVLQAGMMGKGGEIFVLDMGDPVKIVDLANDLIRLSGLNEDDIEIVFTGLRPGEKLNEELLADNEHTLPTPHPKLRIAQARDADEEALKHILAAVNARVTLDDAEVKRVLRQWVPEYTEVGPEVKPVGS